MIYNKEFLISELHRFVVENGKNPKQIEMQRKFGYPSYKTYGNYFGSWNNALIKAGLELNYNNLDGTEICDNCGKNKPENQGWYYINGQRLCMLCYNNSDYMNGNLDPNSKVGFGFIGQRVVAKTLGLELRHDCNCSIGFNAPYDLYDKKLGNINVKTSVLNNKNYWYFTLLNKYTPDTYIMLGFANDKSDILHVWITEPEDDLTFDAKNFKFKTNITITNSEKALKKAEYYEVDIEPYNDMYHTMSLDNCSALRSD